MVEKQGHNVKNKITVMKMYIRQLSGSLYLLDWRACMKILNDKGLYGAKQDLKSTHEYNLRDQLLLVFHFGNGG